MNPSKPPRPYVDHPSFRDRAAYNELLQAPLPPLPPALLLVDDGDFLDQPAPTTLTKDEERRAFLLFNANRKCVHTSEPTTGRRRYEARVQHMCDHIARNNMGLVGYVYQKLKFRLSIDAETAFSWGMQGMLRAIWSFDVARGYRFVTLAHRCIRNSMLSASLIARKRADKFPTVDVLDDWGRETLAAPTAPEDELSEQREALYAALKSNAAKLTPTEFAVVSRFLGMEKVPLGEIGKQIGFSKERTRQIQCKALEKLRLVLRPTE